MSPRRNHSSSRMIDLQVQLLGGQQREALGQVEAHLPAEHAQRAGAGAVAALDAVGQDVGQQGEVLPLRMVGAAWSVGGWRRGRSCGRLTDRTSQRLCAPNRIGRCGSRQLPWATSRLSPRTRPRRGTPAPPASSSRPRRGVAVREAAEAGDDVAVQRRPTSGRRRRRRSRSISATAVVLVGQVLGMLEGQVEEAAAAAARPAGRSPRSTAARAMRAGLGVGGEGVGRAAVEVARELVEQDQQGQRALGASRPSRRIRRARRRGARARTSAGWPRRRRATFSNHFSGPASRQKPRTSLGWAVTCRSSSGCTDRSAGRRAVQARFSGRGNSRRHDGPTVGPFGPWSETMKTKLTAALAACCSPAPARAALAQDRDHGDRRRPRPQAAATTPPAPAAGAARPRARRRRRPARAAARRRPLRAGRAQRRRAGAVPGARPAAAAASRRRPRRLATTGAAVAPGRLRPRRRPRRPAPVRPRARPAARSIPPRRRRPRQFDRRDGRAGGRDADRDERPARRRPRRPMATGATAATAATATGTAAATMATAATAAIPGVTATTGRPGRYPPVFWSQNRFHVGGYRRPTATTSAPGASATSCRAAGTARTTASATSSTTTCPIRRPATSGSGSAATP